MEYHYDCVFLNHPFEIFLLNFLTLSSLIYCLISYFFFLRILTSLFGFLMLSLSTLGPLAILYYSAGYRWSLICPFALTYSLFIFLISLSKVYSLLFLLPASDPLVVILLFRLSFWKI